MGEDSEDFDVDRWSEAIGDMHYCWWVADPTDLGSRDFAVERIAAKPYEPLRYDTGAHPASVRIQHAGDLIDIAGDIVVGLRKADGTRSDYEDGLPGPLDMLPAGRALLAGQLAALVAHTGILLSHSSPDPELPQLAAGIDRFATAAAALERCQQAEKRDDESELTVEDLLAELRDPAPSPWDLPSALDPTRRRAAIDWAGQAVPAMELAADELRRGGYPQLEQLREVLAQLYVATRWAVRLAHRTGHNQVMLRRPGFREVDDRWNDVAAELTHCVYATIDYRRRAY